MSVLGLLAVVAVFGAIGGVVAALTSDDKGFVLPAKVRDSQTTIIRPGFLGLVVVGAVAAAVSFALYGPLTGATAIGGPDPQSGSEPTDQYGLTLASLAGAVLVGAGGSKWLASQVDKQVLQEAAIVAASKNPDGAAATRMASGSPFDILGEAQRMETAKD